MKTQKISYEINPDRSLEAFESLLKASEDVLESFGALVANRHDLMNLQKYVLKCRGLKKRKTIDLFNPRQYR